MPLASLLCLVVAISDGDTLTVRCGAPGAYQQVKVRIAAIDAPAGTKGIYNVASGVAHNQYEDAVAIAKAFSNGKVSTVTLRPNKPGLTRGYCYGIERIKRDLHWSPAFADLDKLYADYRREWERKVFHNYHFIKPEDKPLCFD